MTVAEVVAASTDFLKAKGVPSPRVDAEHLIAKGLGVTRLDLYLQYDRELTEDELTACRALVQRRGTREPLAYILGEWGFRRLTLAVDKRALIPRPETEVVVERCLALLEGVEGPRVLDVGTGTGAIALAIADERPDATVTATDVSEEALTLAVENGERTGLGDRVAFVQRRPGRWAASGGRSTSSSRIRRTSSRRTSTICRPRCATGSRARRWSGTALRTSSPKARATC